MAASIRSSLWRRALLALAAACGSISTAAGPTADGWTADPEAQFLLDVNLHRLTLGDGVRAYQTPEGACVLFGDFLTTLDVPMKIDIGSGRASGWAFTEKNRISIDRHALVAEVKGKRESFALNDVRETPDGWCVDQKALARWFGLAVKADVYNSVLRLDTDRKLPIELAIARKARGEEVARKRKAAYSLASLPRMKLPYRMWRTPALEFVVSAGVRYGGKAGGTQIRRDANIYAAGEIAAMSYMASIAVSPNGLPRNVWARLYRSDPDGNLLGPLHATHVAAGDVPGLSTTFNSTGANGRGLVVTNRPLNQVGSFDRTEFRGRLPDGWDAELYRNGTLIAFDDDPEGKGEYVFSNVDIMVGDNEYEIILHGPQGQEQHIRDTLNVGQDSAPPGKLWYWAGVRQPGKDLLALRKKESIAVAAGPLNATGPPVRTGDGTEAILQAQYGIDKRTAVSALVRSALLDDERVTFVEGAVRRTIGASVVEVAAMT
ncbi:MAG: MSCRAMM family protein, partial [Sphingomicrobium sp.]